MDIAKLQEDLKNEVIQNDMTGVDVSKLRINIYDLTDFDALDELEKFIQTGRRVYLMREIQIPHIVIVSSPRK